MRLRLFSGIRLPMLRTAPTNRWIGRTRSAPSAQPEFSGHVAGLRSNISIRREIKRRSRGDGVLPLGRAASAAAPSATSTRDLFWREAESGVNEIGKLAFECEHLCRGLARRCQRGRMFLFEPCDLC
jgi:hypothetical protein